MDFRALQDAEFGALAAMLAEAFHRKPDGWEGWMRLAGLENWRTVWRHDRLVAALNRVPLSQWYGGRALSNTWISGVGVSPEARGIGAGRLLLAETLKELRDEGVPLSGLYGTTQTFYRRLGWECAGSRYVVETPLRHLTAQRTNLEVRKLEGDDHALAVQLHRQHATSQGCLLRTDYCWRRLRNPQMRATVGHGFFLEGQLKGYCYRVDSEGDISGIALDYTDVLVTCPRSARAFLSFLAGYRALGVKANWSTLNPSPVLMLLADPWQVNLRVFDHWMLRVVHLSNALTQRTYQADGLVELEILDDVLPDNAGRWRLEVRDGQGRLASGGEGTCRLDIRGLACLYSGFADSATVAALGYLEANENERVTLDAMFASARPPQLTDIL